MSCPTKKEECPHLEECRQQIMESDFNICQERIDDEFSFDDCFRYSDMESNAKYFKASQTKTPKKWREAR